MTDRERREARILIAMSAQAQLRLALEPYRYLLGEAPPTIVGLFLEDPRLMAHARSTLAREFVLSGLERRFEAESIERQLRAHWSALRRLLEAEGRRLGIEPEVEIVREDPRAALGSAAERADALVVERDVAREALEIWARARGPQPLRALLLAPPEWPPIGDVVVLVGADSSAETEDSAFETALRLARRTGAPLTVLIAGDAGDAVYEQLTRRARQAGVGIGALVPLGNTSLATLADAARHARVLILPADTDPSVVSALASRLRGATLLWRAPRERASRRRGA